MAYKYTQAQALQKAIILDKLVNEMHQNQHRASQNLEITENPFFLARVEGVRDTNALLLELVELLGEMKFEGEVTA